MPTETCNRVLVERYFLGEGGVDEKRAARAHLDGCAECRGIMTGLEKERRDYLIAHPFREFAAKRLPAEASAEPKRAFGGSRWIPALAGLAACLVLVPVIFKVGLKDKVISDTGYRSKGGAMLEYYVKRGAAVNPGSVTEAYRPGDELQFVCSAGSYGYVTLASIDSRGHVSLYRAPVGADGAESPLSLPGKGDEKIQLPFAVTLDESPGSELFVMIFGAAPLAGEAVESWLTGAFTRASGNLEALPSVLTPPPGSAPKTPAGIKTLLLRKTQA